LVDVEILSVATAVPSNKVSQREISERAQRLFPDLARLDSLYANTGIETRYCVWTRLVQRCQGRSGVINRIGAIEMGLA